MSSNIELVERVYDRFNAREMDAVRANHAPGRRVGQWAGRRIRVRRDGVRTYWTRQWTTMESRAEPTGFSNIEEGTVGVEVHLTGRDLEGNQLFDTYGRHVFQILDGLITRSTSVSSTSSPRDYGAPSASMRSDRSHSLPVLARSSAYERPREYRGDDRLVVRLGGGGGVGRDSERGRNH